MSTTTAIPTRSGSDLVTSAFHNTYFVTGLSDKLISHGMFSDEARTVTAVYTFTTAPVFSTAITIASTLTITANGIAVTGNSTIAGTLGSLTGITSSGTAALATVTVSATLTVTSTITGGGKLTITSGGMETTGNVSHHDGTFIVGTSVTTISLTATTSCNLVQGTASITGAGNQWAIIGNATIAGSFWPTTNADQNNGTGDNRWANVYTDALNFIQLIMNNVLMTITVGANDSGGAGLKAVTLAVPNT